MPKYQAPNHVNSVSVAGVEYKVENGQIDAPYDVQTQIAPLGFVLINEYELKAAAIAEEEAQRKADEAAKQELAAQKKAEAEAKKQAAVEEKARVKAEAEAKATENTSSVAQE